VTEILLGPTLMDGPTTKVKDRSSGKTYFKKRILKEGTFDYKTQSGEKIKLDLTAPELKKYVEAFKNKAYDEVPFQFGHTNDADKRGGTLVQVEHVPGKGIDGYFELDTKAAEYVEKYPNFGVSPRLVLDISRADGKSYEGAIQHVAGTVVPRLNGMGPWEKVELSESEDTDDSTPILDLSTETITIERDRKVTVPEKKTEEGSVVQLSQEEYEFFKSMKTEYEQAQRLLGEADKEKQTAPTQQQIDLSEVTTKAESALSAVQALQKKAVEDGWKAQRTLLAQQGVPPAALDLATPIMTSMETQVFDLSTPDGDIKVDAKTQMLGLLETMKGQIDLSGERGHGVGGTQPEYDNPNDIDAYVQNYLR